MRSTLNKAYRQEDGAALVEFALILPVFLLLALGTLDLGRAFHYWIDGTHLAAEGARWAAVGRNPGPGSTLANSIRDHAALGELRSGGTTSVPTGIQVCVDFPNGTRGAGDPVRVTTTYTYNFFGFIAGKTGIASKTVHNTATMRLERKPTFSAHCST